MLNKFNIFIQQIIDLSMYSAIYIYIYICINICIDIYVYNDNRVQTNLLTLY